MTPRPRLDALAVILAICVLAVSAPPSATVIPSDVTSGVSAETDQWRSGAPDRRATSGAGHRPTAAIESRAPSESPTPRLSPAPTSRGTTAAARPRPSAPPRAVASGTPRKTPRPVPASHTGPTLKGVATYYGTGGPGQYAAMHEYRDGTRVIVLVCAPYNGTAPCITVPVVTQCGACRWSPGATLIDLSVPAWKEIAGGRPLSRGVIAVTVTVLEGSL